MADNQVFRIFVEKKPAYAVEANALQQELVQLLGVSGLKSLRLFNRYDVEGCSKETFDKARNTVFSEPQLDDTFDALPQTSGRILAVEALPGQFDQRADSCAQCIALLVGGERPRVQNARIYVMEGEISEEEWQSICRYLINPVDSREASLELPETLKATYEIPTAVATLTGFISMDEEGRKALHSQMGLAMDLDDLKFCQEYFKSEQRDPSVTEVKVIDTYWSDHCRHTTFGTQLDEIVCDDPQVAASYERFLEMRKELGREKPITLMELATMGVRYLKHKGLLNRLDESDEINACTVKTTVTVDGVPEEWLFLFKNETHNHPTEIEPFGGAATCIGGAIRDPLSGRSYVYQAMRVTGAADPTLPVGETRQGKLPQRKLVTTAAAGYSSYGNQIGLATGQVTEWYHPGFLAKRMEIGAVVGAVPANQVRRECPAAEDVVILLGGKTGRDGCGGATGSSKSHDVGSLTSCGAEVQKGNAPEERKLQRLFRDPEVTRMIKRCNDFGAGGVSVAIGELADGLTIDLNQVPRKYDGLDGTELAISESQERMAVVVAPEDMERFLEKAATENLEATPVAKVTEAKRLTMHWNGNTIVDLSREFLNTNGAPKHTRIHVAEPKAIPFAVANGTPAQMMEALVSDLNGCSQQGLAERFDSTIGAGTLLMPFGGKYQKTRTQIMAAKFPVLKGNTDCCSAMAFGYNPFISQANPYAGAYLAVVESVAKLVAGGLPLEECYLTFQEYFERLGNDPTRWGKPFAALLGALRAQEELGLGSIGGKDSMSGSFEDLDVPPTLVSFAVAMGKASKLISGEFKSVDSKVVLLAPELGEDGLPTAQSLLKNFATFKQLVDRGLVLSCYTPGFGGPALALFQMTLGNRIGFVQDDSFKTARLFENAYGSLIVELNETIPEGEYMGYTVPQDVLVLGGEKMNLADLRQKYDQKLEGVFPMEVKAELCPPPADLTDFAATNWPTPATKLAKPTVLIPVFPGTNCEYDTLRAMEAAGAKAEVIVINNLSAAGIEQSVERVAKQLAQSQIVFLPGGFSGGDEPEGSGKFITAFLRNPILKEEITKLLEQRDGLMCGICNGFQALVKLGLVPFGKIVDTDDNCPTLTFNTIGRHQSKLVTTRVRSNKSPWLAGSKVGDLHTVAISHGEGRFVAPEAVLKQLAANGQIATQYCDLQGNPTMDMAFNPNGSMWAIEGITSPDGRVFGKMGHSERRGTGLYANVPGEKDNKMFENAVAYFK